MQEVTIKQIVEKVYALTQENKLKWEALDSSSDYFTSQINKQELAIFNTGLRYVFEISDLNKNLLGSLTEEYLPLVGPTGEDLSKLNNIGVPRPVILQKLYSLAKKSALDIDKNLSELLNVLNHL